MKKIIILFIALSCAINTFAQHKFDPNKFKTELRQYILSTVNLTEEEANNFFKIYDEMQVKKRALHASVCAKQKCVPQNNNVARTAIMTSDNLRIQIKQVEKAYHQKMLLVIPATKLFNVLKAERRFHKQYLKKASRK